MPSSHGPASALPMPENSVAKIAPIRADFRMHSPICIAKILCPRGFLPARRMPRHGELGLDGPLKLATSLAAEKIGRTRGPRMTYCCGILVRDGLVMIADTRTNAGLDNVSTFRKLHIFSKPGERIMAIASAGNLAVSQSLVSTLTEGIENPETKELDTLLNAPTMFQAAQRIGRAIRQVNKLEGAALEAADVKFDVSFLFAGQIKDERM